MPDEIADWKQIAAALHVALPQIDQALSQANVPISRRKLKAFDIVQETMLDVTPQASPVPERKRSYA